MVVQLIQQRQIEQRPRPGSTAAGCCWERRLLLDLSFSWRRKDEPSVLRPARRALRGRRKGKGAQGRRARWLFQKREQTLPSPPSLLDWRRGLWNRLVQGRGLRYRLAGRDAGAPL